MDVLGWTFPALLVVAAVTVLVLAVASADDIRRYRRIKRM